MGENFVGGDTDEKNKLFDRQKKDEKHRETRDMRKLLKQPEFRRFCWRKLSEAGIFRASFNLNTKMADFREGQRDLGILLLQELNMADPNVFSQMQREAVSEALSKPQKEESTNAE